MKSALWSIAKYVLAICMLIFIVRQAGPEKILGYLKQIPPAKILLCLALITLAQISAALRMRYFFLAAGFDMRRSFAILLFYVGSFYNFLLPGGIGGDAYKVFLVRKRMNVTTAQGIRIMVADRASGLCIILFTVLGALYLLDLSALTPYAHPLIIVAAIIALSAYLFFSRLLVKMGPGTMLSSLPYSFTTQALWMGALLNIWSALGGGKYAVEYILLYCASSITGMLPVSVGGLGIKEMTYYYGAAQIRQLLHSSVDGDLGIAISLCLFFLVFVSSLPGLFWLNTVEKAEHS